MALPVLVATALGAGKLRRSRFPNVCVGEFAHPVKRRLQFLQIHLVAPIRRDWNLAAYTHERTGKRLRDHAAVPSFENPRSIERDVKSHHWRSGAARQNNRSWLSHVARAFRAINGESRRPAFIQLPPHSKQSTNCAFGTRPPYFHESELLHDASGVFAVEAVAAHHPDLQVATPVHGGDHAVVPEGIDEWPLGQAARRTVLPGNREANGWPENADRDISRPGNEPEKNTLS